MRFNFISEYGDGLGIAKRVFDEGEQARIWIRDANALQIGEGIVEKAGSLEDLIEDASIDDDVFIFDGSANGIIADMLRNKGLAVLGGSLIADKLERDREFGKLVMTEAKLQTPKTVTFNSFDDGIAYAKSTKKDERLVYKPSKMLGEASLSRICYDQEDCIVLLTNTKDENPLAKPEFDLQHFVDGVPISTECWFDGQDFIEGLWNHTLERKELLNDNLGPSGGCVGNITWACGLCSLCEELRKIKPFLQKHNYIGPLDYNAILTEEGEAFGLEWTPRFGYDAAPALLFQLVDGSVSQFLADVAKRQYNEQSSPALRAGIASGIRITIPPWPTERYNAEADIPLRGLNDKDLEDVYLYNVKADKHDESQLSSAGAWGILLLPTGRGETIRTSFREPYRIAEKVRIPDKQYRTDLIEQFQKDAAFVESSLKEEILQNG